VVVEIVKALHGWFVAHRPKVKVTVTLKEGSSFIVDAENVRDLDSLVANVRAALTTSTL
jgi:hypothetical protein